MPRYKNLGGPWRRGPNQTVPHGGVFEATPREHARFIRRGLRGRFELVSGRQAANVPPPPGAWPLKMAPAMYLKLHPKGQHADKARELLGKGRE